MKYILILVAGLSLVGCGVGGQGNCTRYTTRDAIVTIDPRMTTPTVKDENFVIPSPIATYTLPIVETRVIDQVPCANATPRRNENSGDSP